MFASALSAAGGVSLPLFAPAPCIVDTPANIANPFSSSYPPPPPTSTPFAPYLGPASIPLLESLLHSSSIPVPGIAGVGTNAYNYNNNSTRSSPQTNTGYYGGNQTGHVNAPVSPVPFSLPAPSSSSRNYGGKGPMAITPASNRTIRPQQQQRSQPVSAQYVFQALLPLVGNAPQHQLQQSNARSNTTFEYNSKKRSHSDEDPMPSSNDAIRRLFKQGCQCYVIIDTNVLINHLEETCALQHQVDITVVIPSIVIHELDGLKKEMTSDVGYRARLAIKAVRESLGTSGQTWIRGQRPEESALPSHLERNNDDKILSCALHYKKTFGTAILVTADNGLHVKALINDLPTTDLRSLLRALPPANARHSIKRRRTVEAAPTSQDNSIPISNSETLNKRAQLLPVTTGSTVIPGFSILPSDLEKKAVATTTFDTLPDELITKVLAFLQPRSLLLCQQVCVRWFRLANDNAIWRDALHRSFRLTLPSTDPAKNDRDSAYIEQLWDVEEEILSVGGGNGTGRYDDPYRIQFARAKAVAKRNKGKSWYLAFARSALPLSSSSVACSFSANRPS